MRRIGDVVVDDRRFSICMGGDNSVGAVVKSSKSRISRIAERAFVVYGGEERFPIQRGVEAVSLREMAALVRDL